MEISNDPNYPLPLHPHPSPSQSLSPQQVNLIMLFDFFGDLADAAKKTTARRQFACPENKRAMSAKCREELDAAVRVGARGFPPALLSRERRYFGVSVLAGDVLQDE
ncbi:hypothetical protein CFIO01_02540 [Colletotrichum fioriniae PJ7]|uniref:Uncharacterized protein n=1 Tax=Colletotrichum fioriniae PJ7 TaxID=1445577 RepID=A0A010RXK7_9PEZI|nr:hypothetical protein CFIO01_02540 [Colletotrichum fioriniae PJ7]